MNNLKIVGPALPDMPWEERPAGSKEVMWRYSANPIIGRDALSTSNSIFNSAVVPFKKGKYNYAGVFRCDDTNRRMRIHAGFSVDGIDWDIREEDFKLVGGDAEIGQWVYGYDPRVAKIGGVRGFGLAVHEDRRGARAHRDQRRVAVVLPRGAPFVQRLRLCVRLGIARPG